MIISRIKELLIFAKVLFCSCSLLATSASKQGMDWLVVKSKKGKALMEEVGEEYLANLIHRNLVQVSKVYIDGKARSCRVHDLLHEVLRRKSAGSSFYHVLSEDESTFEPVTRRLLIYSSPSKALRSITQSHIRFVFTFYQAEWPKSFLNTWSGNLKLVIVCSTQSSSEIRGVFVSLEVLKPKEYEGEVASGVHWQSVKLRKPGSKTVSDIFLGYCYDYNIEFSLKSEQGVKIDDVIGCVQALQKVKANHGGINLIKALGKLRQLSKA
ncbi:hypothetical protein DVH24_026069 [Malus domestica]|uniref:Disease resistance protein winged helix domain-containing protein n=1 Tax=Malus domestica TaxID=3750 RepID=A0A498KNQ4_MALDO|nr:hypothetical protein DVH24_026069 [Malus domestica]